MRTAAVLLALVVLSACAVGCGGPSSAEIEGRVQRFYMDAGISGASKAQATCSDADSGSFDCTVEILDGGGQHVCSDRAVVKPHNETVEFVHENGSCNYGSSF